MLYEVGTLLWASFIRLLSKTSLDKVFAIFVLGGGAHFSSMNTTLFIGMYMGVA